MAVLNSSVATRDAFDEWWRCEGEWVDAPNRRRGGESGVVRVHDPVLGLVYVKRQVGHTYWNLWFPFGRATALRERDALLALPKIRVAVPDLVYCAARRVSGRWHTVLITRALEGMVDLRDWYSSGYRDEIGELKHANCLREIGRMLGRLHRHHWQHTSLYDKHIFLAVPTARSNAQGQVALIDLENCRRTFNAAWGARHDLRQLRRHTAMWSDKDWTVMLEGHAESFGRRVL